MNIFLFPTDDRSGQLNFIYHYSKLGHKVFVPRHGTFALNWKRIATWPALLCKSSSDPTKRNIEIEGFNRTDETCFGEDTFLVNFELPELYADDVSCQLVDETFDEQIDVFHTLRGGEAYLSHYFAIAEMKFPNAKWVSSTFNQYTTAPGGHETKNAAKLIPAPYENEKGNVNNVCLLATDFEARVLGVDLELAKQYERVGFASFNHNFAERQPSDFRLFCSMNALLRDKHKLPCVHNFGGNIRTQGADVRFSGDRGITGHFITITPNVAYGLTATLRSVVHFKADDWGGGVFYYSLNCGTPVVTTARYIAASSSERFLVHGKNCLVVNSPEEAADALARLQSDYTLVSRLSQGMLEMKETVFDSNYWSNWERFLEGLL